MFIRVFTICVTLFCVVVGPPQPARSETSGLNGVWLGQDGHDSVGPSSTVGPSDVQDIHIELQHLPADKDISTIAVDRLGGGRWVYHGTWGPWAAELDRSGQSPTAQLYLEPSHTTNPSVHITIHFADQSISEFDVSGGPADPNLRMSGTAVRAAWIGQGGKDYTGPGPAVGPDGKEDVHVALSQLSTHIPVKSLRVIGPNNRAWQYGLNPERDWNAELIQQPTDQSKADLYFSPGADLHGNVLTLKVTYANDKTDQTTVVAGPCDPNRRIAFPVAPVIVPNSMSLRWAGQDLSSGPTRGLVHVVVNSVERAKNVAFAVLSDPAGGLWKSTTASANDGNLAFKIHEDLNGADIAFAPIRDEMGTTLTLSLHYADGGISVVQFKGHHCDPLAQGPLPANKSVVVHPGDNLQALTTHYGTIQLAPGTYRLERPLILDSPISLIGKHGSELLFAQKADSPSWNTAIEIHCSNTTLSGFTVRFAGPIRWSDQGGSAVISASRSGSGKNDPRINLVIGHMDIEGPPVPLPVALDKLVPSPFLMRLGDATSGRIIGNRLRGGTTDVTGGPWEISDNTYDGAISGTMSWDTFGGHYLHDFFVARNVVSPLPGSGKTWRFLVMTQWGMRDRVVGNYVRGVGIMNGDGIPNPNAPELFLTEAYRLQYEGVAHRTSSGGRVLQIPYVMDGTVATGTVAAILSGPHAGEWYRVAQPIDSTTYLMERPMPHGEYAVSLSNGFVQDVYAHNTIDNRGGSSVPLDLAGTHFGTQILNNHLLGGVGAMLSAMPTERPNLWGWSHVPFFGVIMKGNVVEDSIGGIKLDSEGNEYNKSSSGRTYINASLVGNSVRWTSGFLARQSDKWRADVPAIRFGPRSKLTGSEFQVHLGSNTVTLPPHSGLQPYIYVKNAQVNGKLVVNSHIPLRFTPFVPER